VDRRAHSEWSDVVDDSTSAPDNTETGGSGGEGTIAQRLNRVTRYASGGAKAHPTEPAGDRDLEEQPASDFEEPVRHEVAPAATDQHRPAPAEQVLHEPAPAEETPYEPVPRQETLYEPRPADEALDEPAPASQTMAQAPTTMPEAPQHPPVDQDVRYEEAPAEEACQGVHTFDDALPETSTSEATIEVPPALADLEPEPAASQDVAPAPAEPPYEPPSGPAEAQQASLGVEIQPEVPPESASGVDLASAEPPAETPGPAPENGERLTVGRGIRLVAKLCECAELLVEGHLEATARARHLLVAEGGCFIGSAEVDSAEVHGHFEGNLTVAHRLSISATGKVAGTTRYQEIVIEAGGQVMGNAQRLQANGGGGH
jgi:cytoskeletal protein CcmA (bactofilin family)